MVRYPYTLEVWRETDAIQDADGHFIEGHAEWVEHCACNYDGNGQAREAVGSNGKVFVYSYEVKLPSYAQRLEDGVNVRIIDEQGNNVFDGQPKTENKGKSFYPVRGYDQSGQRLQDRRLWL